MSSITTNLASKTLKRRLLPFTPKPITIISRSSSSSSETQTQKLERIADVLLDLTKIERHDYAILFRHKMGLGRYGPAVSGAILSGPAAPGSASGDVKTAAAAEKTAFDIKLEKFDAAAKIKVIKEVRTFTDLGLKEAKDLVEKVPVVLKKGLTKEEAGPIIEKLKALGATVRMRMLVVNFMVNPLDCYWHHLLNCIRENRWRFITGQQCLSGRHFTWASVASEPLQDHKGNQNRLFSSGVFLRSG